MKRTTIAMIALAALPAVAVAQDSTSQGGQRQTAPQTAADSNRAMQAQTPAATSESAPAAGQAGQQPGQTGARAAGAAQGRRTAGGGTTGRGMNLNRDQIIELQNALTTAGCDAGTADGVMGPRTRRAISCARKKNNVSSNEELYRSLNLDFSSGGGGAGGNVSADTSGGNVPSTNSQGAAADSPAASATRGDSAQVGGANRGRIYPPADSVRKATTKADSSKHPAGHDSTMRNQAPPSKP